MSEASANMILFLGCTNITYCHASFLIKEFILSIFFYQCINKTYSHHCLGMYDVTMYNFMQGHVEKAEKTICDQ